MELLKKLEESVSLVRDDLKHDIDWEHRVGVLISRAEAETLIPLLKGGERFNQPTERKGVKAPEEYLKEAKESTSFKDMLIEGVDLVPLKALTAMQEDYEQKFRECLVVLKRLSLHAQTTGGTAGPDIGLQGVISEAEQFIKANKG